MKVKVQIRAFSRAILPCGLTTIGRVAAGAKARFADTFPTFNPQGSLAREKARICALTFTCSEGGGHPTNAGYRSIAAAVWAASGYSDRS